MSRVGALIAVGRTSDVYEFGRGSVVKVPRPAVPRHWAAEEAQFTDAVRELGAPAPTVLDVVEVAGHARVGGVRVRGRHAPGRGETLQLVVRSEGETAIQRGDNVHVDCKGPIHVFAPDGQRIGD